MRSGWKLVLTLAVLLSSGVATTGGVFGQERRIIVAADPALQASGLMAHMVPRFSLKTSIRITAVPLDGAEAEGADVLLAPAGALPDATPVLRDAERSFAARSTHDSADAAAATYAARFVDWLGSDTGKSAIEGFAPDGRQIYFATDGAVEETAEVPLDGDAKLGARLSLQMCGRCHVIGPQNRMKGLGSTPSFGVVRTFADWETRFTTFYLLNPHPAFTQIADVTEPFDETRPPPIIPLEMTLEDLEAILAFVAGLDPAELGAPIRHQ